MNEVYIEPTTGTPFLITTVLFDSLIPFLTKESMLHVSEGTQDGNNCYLGYNTDLKRSVSCHAAYCGENIVAYAMVLKNDPKHLVRLYTTPGFRCLGLGTAFMFGLDIQSLGCLRENRAALALYKRLGFEPVDESSVVMTLKRTR